MSDTQSITTTRSRATQMVLVGGVVLAWVLVVSGCRKPLFRELDERSPYAKYDKVRGQNVPPYRFNEFGRRVPNLRARLAPKE